MPKKVLSISYDDSLLETRRLLLEKAGFTVISICGFIDALKECERAGDFDLVILGHSIPRSDKVALFSLIKKRCLLPILSIVRNSEEPLPGVDFYVRSLDGPEALLETVQRATQPLTEAADAMNSV